MNENTKTLHFGKPWTNAFVYKTFKGADNKRNTILSEGLHQVKVKKRSDGQFVVKTRDLETPEPAKKKKRKVKRTEKK